MGLSWPIMSRLIEDGSDIGLPFPTHASGNNRPQRPIIPVNTRW